MPLWHYEKDGNRLGPVSDDDVRQLVQQRALASHTLVWKQGFTDWCALGETELARHLEAATAPPALPAAHIDNVVVWLLACAPLIGMVTEAMLAGALAPSDELAGLAGQMAVRTGQYWWVTLVLNIGLSVLDERRLKRAGVDTSGFGKLVLIVPVYLWKRAKSLNQTPSYFWTWIALFGVTLLAGS
ncbi:DUF4339 domain-containing protein [Burkholderia metallica]|uniref:DUF4339 domain-containing protein n=1 Tax=Burkholderia metallica TaxID=488729 RepID=UPI00157AD5A2|nr:DUF4339 domain-containing protein [Burkholderia metallica]NTZ82557.1 DUF4339 domain-containing protein [Burkholderia metallica]